MRNELNSTREMAVGRGGKGRSSPGDLCLRPGQKARAGGGPRPFHLLPSARFEITFSVVS